MTESSAAVISTLRDYSHANIEQAKDFALEAVRILTDEESTMSELFLSDLADANGRAAGSYRILEQIDSMQTSGLDEAAAMEMMLNQLRLMLGNLFNPAGHTETLRVLYHAIRTLEVAVQMDSSAD